MSDHQDNRGRTAGPAARRESPTRGAGPAAAASASGVAPVPGVSGAASAAVSGPGSAGSASSSAAGRRGRPRSEAAERSIVEAVVHLLEDGVPLSELSIERIARTAGVGKATIYRRWEGKEALFVDVVRSMEPVDPPLPGASVRDDLVAMLEMMRQRGLAKRSSALLHNVFAQMQSYPKLWDMYHRTSVLPRRQRMDEVLRRGIANGEIRADVDFDLLGDLFVGPMLVRTVLRPDGTPGEGAAERIVDAVLDGVRPPL
ncbi:TetR/AcrR family transcriptional regulator [Streptomyces sp. NPDC005283]|uniref:TetR/AcrR family transcriptional regulator n=1 Tax=Streptomyces sp. NPDC005283 TaxID=3156871 RepID=UPI0034562A4F